MGVKKKPYSVTNITIAFHSATIKQKYTVNNGSEIRMSWVYLCLSAYINVLVDCC